MQAFSNSDRLSLAEQNLKAIFEAELIKVAAIAQQISEKFEIKRSFLPSTSFCNTTVLSFITGLKLAFLS